MRLMISSNELPEIVAFNLYKYVYEICFDIYQQRYQQAPFTRRDRYIGRDILQKFEEDADAGEMSDDQLKAISNHEEHFLYRRIDYLRESRQRERRREFLVKCCNWMFPGRAKKFVPSSIYCNSYPPE